MGDFHAISAGRVHASRLPKDKLQTWHLSDSAMFWTCRQRIPRKGPEAARREAETGIASSIVKLGAQERLRPARPSGGIRPGSCRRRLLQDDTTQGLRNSFSRVHLTDKSIMHFGPSTRPSQRKRPSERLLHLPYRRVTNMIGSIPSDTEIPALAIATASPIFVPGKERFQKIHSDAMVPKEPVERGRGREPPSENPVTTISLDEMLKPQGTSRPPASRVCARILTSGRRLMDILIFCQIAELQYGLTAIYYYDWDAKYSAQDTTSPLESQVFMAEKLIEGGKGPDWFALLRSAMPHFELTGDDTLPAAPPRRLLARSPLSPSSQIPKPVFRFPMLSAFFPLSFNVCHSLSQREASAEFCSPTLRAAFTMLF
ncbi:hypothetical protein CSOJ01_15271 [Colletotrichum sojae]|uniref:Uncharacterized protein n=1 Tax=Colletotrichum sojae TaxID=2175907 RepID=A0A8H6IMY1_9PEZI|nr:hypothetical protein CSOJ01_15271 [Colletotrichum sojae]